MNENFKIQLSSEGGKDESWNLSFRHYAFQQPQAEDNTKRNVSRVGIILEAVRCDEDTIEGEKLLVGTSSFLPGQKPERMVFTTYPEGIRLLQPLVAQGMARMKEPGGQSLDMTELYNRYIQLHRRAMLDSPLSYVRVHEGKEGTNLPDMISCRIGGIEQPRQQVGIEGGRFAQVAELYSECRYQLHELATQIYAGQLQLYREAQGRVSDFTHLTRKGSHFIRCRIDGEQQMAKEINLLDICDYKRDKDQAAIVAKYFARELVTGEKLSQGRGR